MRLELNFLPSSCADMPGLWVSGSSNGLTWQMSNREHIACRYAMKTLEKSEMLERNKVGRVLTEEGILNQGMLPRENSAYMSGYAFISFLKAGPILHDTGLHTLL